MICDGDYGCIRVLPEGFCLECTKKSVEISKLHGTRLLHHSSILDQYSSIWLFFSSLLPSVVLYSPLLGIWPIYLCHYFFTEVIPPIFSFIILQTHTHKNPTTRNITSKRAKIQEGYQNRCVPIFEAEWRQRPRESLAT